MLFCLRILNQYNPVVSLFLGYMYFTKHKIHLTMFNEWLSIIIFGKEIIKVRYATFKD